MPVKALVRKSIGAKSNMFPEGLNRAILVEVEEHDTKNNSSVRLVFANGDFEHNEDLWLSEKAQGRLTLISRRLGLIKDTGDEEQEVLFDNAVGTEYVIDIAHEKNQNDETVTKMTYSGVWPMDHEDKKIRAFLNTAAGKKEATAGVREPGSSSKPSSGDDLDDI